MTHVAYWVLASVYLLSGALVGLLVGRPIRRKLLERERR